MFSALAGAVMATKVHFAQMKNNITKKQDRQVQEYIYNNKVNKEEVKEKYEKSRLPKSGYMTVEEYESASRAKTKKEINAKILEKGEMEKPANMVYVPQYRFKLIKYNEPVGSPELTLPRKLNFDRQINAQGIVSGDITRLVYPAVYYYAQSDCTCCDLFLINLDPTLTDIEKVEKANILNKEPKPLISTDKDIDTMYVFRTLTPIDFSTDNKKLAVKEKVGYKHDGIWKTDLWIYDFDKKEATKLPQIREAITYYWKNQKGVELNEKRWDIYPMGFDANDNNRIIVCAYAYTGDVPQFLGTWSIDTEGKNSKLEALDGSYIPVAVVGFRLAAEEYVIPISELEFEAKQVKQKAKIERKKIAEDKKIEKTQSKVEYKRKIHQMDMDTLMKIRERQNAVKEYKKNYKSVDGVTGD